MQPSGESVFTYTGRHTYTSPGTGYGRVHQEGNRHTECIRHSGPCLVRWVLPFSGRITRVSSSGQKLRFYDIRGDGERLQVMANFSYHDEKSGDFFENHNRFRRGDVIGQSRVVRAGFLGFMDTALFSEFVPVMTKHGVVLLGLSAR